MTERSLMSRGAAETRRRLVDAAERVIRAKGLARATTKEIAREAGCAEGTLYLHFADKLDLIRAVQEQLLPVFVELLRRLPGEAGTRTVAANLIEVAEQGMTVYRDFLPVNAGVFADPELLGRLRRRRRERGTGPSGPTSRSSPTWRPSRRSGGWRPASTRSPPPSCCSAAASSTSSSSSSSAPTCTPSATARARPPAWSARCWPGSPHPTPRSQHEHSQRDHPGPAGRRRGRRPAPLGRPGGGAGRGLHAARRHQHRQRRHPVDPARPRRHLQPDL